MKQFCKSLCKDGECWKVLCSKFPKLSDAKLKEGIFIGPQIRKLLTDSLFLQSMNDNKKEAWESFRDVLHNFLGNRKAKNYKEIVNRMLMAFQAQGCNMSLNVYFSHSHVDYFPENLGAYSEEKGEKFHRDIMTMERRYQGRMYVNMMADYSWMLKRESTRKRNRRSIKNTKKFI